MSRKYWCKIPANARITIDYNNKRKPVKFSYPKKQSLFKATYWSITSVWLKITIWTVWLSIPFLAWHAYDSFSLFVPKTQEMVQQCMQVPKHPALWLVPSLTGIKEDPTMWIAVSIVVFHLFVFPLILTLIWLRNKKLMALLPRLNRVVHTGKTYHYQKVTKINDKIFIVPYFKNIFLDYEAKKEFAKYLTKVEIVEHKAKDWHKAHLWSKPKLEVNEWIWIAKFHFSQIPQSGRLEVWYT